MMLATSFEDFARGSVVPIFEALLNSSRLRAKKPFAARDLVIRIVVVICEMYGGKEVWGRSSPKLKIHDDVLDSWHAIFIHLETSSRRVKIQYLFSILVPYLQNQNYNETVATAS